RQPAHRGVLHPPGRPQLSSRDFTSDLDLRFASVQTSNNNPGENIIMSKIKSIVQIVSGLTLGAAACLTLPSANAKSMPAAACAIADPADIIPSGGTMWALYDDGQVLCPLQRARDNGSL